MGDRVTLTEKLETRHHGLLRWLRANHPEVLPDSATFSEPTARDTAFWHSGYMIAVADVLRAIGRDAA